jgi:uncharacterized protein YqeY
MSPLITKIKDDLFNAMKHEIKCKKQDAAAGLDSAIVQKNVSRAIISMFPEIKKKTSNATDEDTLKLIKKYINQQKERELYIQKHLIEDDIIGINPQQLKKLIKDKFQELGDKLTSPEIETAKKYLPKAVTEQEIINWINTNIVLSALKNKMQAMGPITKHFKGTDGNFIKSILMKM